MNQESLEQIFTEAFTSYGDAIFRFCILKVSNVELAENMTQEVFTRYWQSLREGKEMTNTRSYLYTIANHMAIDWYKKRKEDSLDARMETGFVPQDAATDPETRAAYEEVIRAMHDMEERDREVLLLRHVEGFEPKDIATLLGETANTVSVRLNRARRRLQEKLDI
jgi:RNA polymerase sigma-70 factor (ECF subfamily)